MSVRTLLQLSKIISRKFLKTLIINFIRPRFTIFSVKNNSIRLGSNYGGKSILELPSLYGGWVISAGAGEDLSFDFELIKRFNCKIVILDPTPRAILYFKELMKHFGNSSKSNYSNSGTQPFNSYDLRDINRSYVFYVAKALWWEEKDVNFFPPLNPSHVSYSIENLQSTQKIENIIVVPTITVKKLCSQYGIESIALVKLDIEGASIKVCKHMFSQKIFPQQIVIEFDELLYPKFRNILNIRMMQLIFFLNRYRLGTKTSNMEVTYFRRSD